MSTRQETTTTLFKEPEKSKKKKNKKPGIYNVCLVLGILGLMAIITNNLSFSYPEGLIIIIMTIACGCFLFIYEILNWKKKD